VTVQVAYGWRQHHLYPSSRSAVISRPSLAVFKSGQRPTT
jgi:hypothetical protein